MLNTYSALVERSADAACVEAEDVCRGQQCGGVIFLLFPVVVSVPFHHCGTVVVVAFEPPRTWQQLPAVHVENGANPPYLMKALEDDDSQWNLVEENPRTTLQLSRADEGAGFMPETTTFKFADGKTRWFGPNDPILIGPVTERRGGERQHIREVAVSHGWDWDWLHDDGEDKDVFTRTEWRVEVNYEGDDAGEALRFHRGEQKTFPFTGRGAKSAAINWLEAGLEPT